VSEAKSQLAEFLAEQEGEDGPEYFTYPSFLCYLARASPSLDCGAFASSFAQVAARLLELAGGPVYLADGSAFAAGELRAEFIELDIFRLPLAEAFIESPLHPGIFIETRRFADLHLLSRMRRELRRTGLAAGCRCVDVVRALLGLPEGEPRS